MISEKSQLISELNAAKDDNLIRKILRLAELQIEDVRKDNDSANRVHSLRNQGEIRGFRWLVQTIQRGLPPRDNF
ncbi:hypothetical protein EHM76_06855 [bacterium]|nr:MAG: hypothetical protein EHM76_06855 [bacterium]